MCTTRMYATLQPPRRHEQNVSSTKIYALYCNANLRLALLTLCVQKKNWILDQRRHEQVGEFKKKSYERNFALLRLATNESVSLFDMCRG